jgi:protein AbiQ
MGGDMLNFFIANKSYLDLLRESVPTVPYSEYEGRKSKFMCGVLIEVNGMDYYAPVSSNKNRYATSFILKNEQDRPLASIRFNYMVPVPKDLVEPVDIANEPDEKYRRLLETEYIAVNKNSSAIMSAARRIYKIKLNNPETIIAQHCNDFRLLEKLMKVYDNSRHAERETKFKPAPETPRRKPR